MKCLALLAATLLILSVMTASGCQKEQEPIVRFGGTSVTVTAVTSSLRAQLAIYVGEEQEEAAIGYMGYRFMVEEDRAVLYRAGNELIELAGKKLAGVRKMGNWICDWRSRRV